MSYTTQMDAARQGFVTPEMEIVAAKENMDVEKLRELIAKGQVIIPANRNHRALSPNGIGSALKTKINVNLGTSRDCVDLKNVLFSDSISSILKDRYSVIKKELPTVALSTSGNGSDTIPSQQCRGFRRGPFAPRKILTLL